MPKDTFKQLPEEKAERIIESAADLFSERGFSRTDVAEIASRSGVAKGSIYNYFESKDDLFMYVCRDGLARWREAVYGDIDKTWDVYHQIDHMFEKGAAFAQEHPKYIRLYLNVTASGMEEYAEELTPESEGHFAIYFKSLLERGIEEGIVRSDLDIPLTSFLINSLYLMFLLSLVSRHFQIRIKEYLGMKGSLDNKADEVARRVVDLIRTLLKPMS
jgi:AcrR family transcriptional regulator